VKYLLYFTYKLQELKLFLHFFLRNLWRLWRLLVFGLYSTQFGVAFEIVLADHFLLLQLMHFGFRFLVLHILLNHNAALVLSSFSLVFL